VSNYLNFLKGITYIIMCIHETCKNDKEVYGKYCYKHRSNHLLNKEGCIIFERFTKKTSDYVVNDLRNTLKSLHMRNSLRKTNKQTLYTTLLQYYTDKIEPYHVVTSEIIYIQRHYKKTKNKEINILRGEGFINMKLCNNDFDFYTYETPNEIDTRYFFSYKDKQHFIWFFDIRSFNKLIEKKQGNPYTRDEIPLDIIQKALKLSNILGIKDHLIKKTLHLTRKQNIKQKTIDIFSTIEQCGYECHFDWFLDLDIRHLRKLYRNLEDIWNYRLQLTQDTKSRIVPPHGEIFTIPVNDVFRIMNIYTLQECILNEITKFNSAISDEDKKLGYMYFLIGLGQVSSVCYHSHHWMMYI
jgi:hypothetical protein